MFRFRSKERQSLKWLKVKTFYQSQNILIKTLIKDNYYLITDVSVVCKGLIIPSEKRDNDSNGQRISAVG